MTTLLDQEDDLIEEARPGYHTLVRQGITSWIHGWKRNGWRTADKRPVKNVELWQRLAAASAPHKLHWTWVKGHSGHPENERADVLTRSEIGKIRGR